MRTGRALRGAAFAFCPVRRVEIAGVPPYNKDIYIARRESGGTGRKKEENAVIRIAIVEDEPEYARQLEQFLQRYAAENNQPIQTVCFSDGDEIALNYKPDYDIILLDVQMKFMDGMTAAEIIRQSDPEVVIIFITNMAQYAIRGYAVDALDYVLKPVSYFAFSQRLKRAIGRMKKRERRFVTVIGPGGGCKLEVSRLLYVESQGHNLAYHTDGEEITVPGTMKEAEEKLVPLGFFRINKGCLVNLENVDSVRDGCAQVAGRLLPVSRGKKKEFMEKMNFYMNRH